MNYGDCEGMDNHTVMAVQSLLESQNVQETLQGYFTSVLLKFNFDEKKDYFKLFLY